MSDDGPFYPKHGIGPPGISVRLHRLDRRSDKVEAVVEFANDSAISRDLENVRGMLFSSEESSASSGIYEEYSGTHHITLPAGSSRHLSMTYAVGARPIDRLRIEVADGEATLHIGDLPHL
jgi:hypothetical protein